MLVGVRSSHAIASVFGEQLACDPAVFADTTKVVVPTGESSAEQDRGDRHDRLSALFHAHARGVRAYVARHHPDSDGDDILAETFIIAWRRLEDVPPDAPRPWLIGIARNVARNASRSQRRRDAGLDAFLAGRPAVSVDLNGSRPPLELVEQVTSAFGHLGADDQEVILLAAWDGLTGRDLGAVLGMSAGRAADRLHRARVRLREQMSRTA